MKAILLANRLLKIDGKTFGIGERLPDTISKEDKARFIARRWVNIITIASEPTSASAPPAGTPASPAPPKEPPGPSEAVSVPETKPKRQRKTTSASQEAKEE